MPAHARCTAEWCRPTRRPPARSAPFRTAGCTSDSARTARTPTASGRCRRRPPPGAPGARRIQCERRRAWDAPPRGREEIVSYFRSPDPRNTHAGIELHQFALACSIRSRPFCCTSRETMPTNGRPIASSPRGRPNAPSSARLHSALPDRSLGAEVRRQQRVRFRIPDIGVDAVENPEIPIAERAQYTFETRSGLRRQRLGGIGRADGRDAVSRRDPGLQKTELSPEFAAIQAEAFPGQMRVPAPRP